MKPDVVNVSKFFARPRTLAAEMTENSVPLAETKRRSNTAARIAAEVREERNRRWVGWKGEVLVNEVGKVSGSFVGRNFAYKPIVVKSNGNLFGKKAQVEIVQAHSTYLEGKLCE
jgi:tRNA A37 methylthiotransferase MiaB